MNKIKNIIELPYVKYTEKNYGRLGTWDTYEHIENRFNPFQIAYLYFKNKPPLIIKGDSQSIEEYLKKSHSKDNYVMHSTTYMGGKNFSSVNVHLSNDKYKVYSMRDSKSNLPRRKSVSVYDRDTKENVFKKRMRRIPRGWIKELNQFC